MNAFINADGKPIVMGMVRAIQENKAYLSEIDGLIGDGDHGANMNKGFSVTGERIKDQNLSFTDCLDELGTILLSEIGGSMGPIYGTIFLEMADAGAGAEEIDAKVFSSMLTAAITGLEDIVEARVGDKTLFDTLVPARDAFDEATAGGEDFRAALEKMKTGSRAGRDSTKDMVARFGRSSRLGERSRGVLDAGATSCDVILEAMADGILAIL